jgi:hypothetical protein
MPDLRWCRSSVHAVEFVLGILNFHLSQVSYM